MSKIIYLQFGEHIYELAILSESFKGHINDFIKIRLNSYTKAETEGSIKVEYSIHPTRVHKKEIFSKDVNLKGFENIIKHEGSKRINYFNMHDNIGYDNFYGKVLVVYQCCYLTGFSSQKNKIDFKIIENVLKLDIEYDDPFWLGILFCKNKEELVRVFKRDNIYEYKFFQYSKGFVVLAVRKLVPAWEKLKVPKEEIKAGDTDWHENFFFKNQ